MENIVVPSRWNEVPVKMFKELAGLDKTDGEYNVIDFISVLSDQDPEDIKQIGSVNLPKILASVQWVFTLPNSEYKTEVEIDGVTYYLVKLNSLSLAQRADLDEYVQFENLHKFFAVLYRPANDVYSVDSMLRRAELFDEKMNIEDVYGTLAFFLTIAIASIEVTRVYSSV